MIYDDKAKIKTAKKLKKLRIGPTRLSGSFRSHKTLEKDLHENSGHTFWISSKQLSNYEAINRGKTNYSRNRFESGKGMKISTLVELANYYGVSCDYLLGTKVNKKTRKNEVGLELCLDKESIDVLSQLYEKSTPYFEKIKFTLNNLIHSLVLTDENTQMLELEYNEQNEDNPREKNLIQKPLLNRLSEYLYFSCVPQSHNIIAKDDSDYLFETYGQRAFSEAQVTNLYFVGLQNMLLESRSRHDKIRDLPDHEIDKAMKRIKR